MATPGSKELNDPNAITFQDQLVKVGRRQFDNIGRRWVQRPRTLGDQDDRQNA